MKKVLSEKYRARAKAELGELKTPQSQLEKPSIGVNGPAAEGGLQLLMLRIMNIKGG